MPGATGLPVPGPFLTAALEVLDQQGEGGGLLGFPLMHVKVIVRGGKVHETESNELAFRLAAADAFDKGLREAGIVLLEPIMRLEITTPEDYLGEFVGDLQQRRGTITGTHHRGRSTVVIDARAPWPRSSATPTPCAASVKAAHLHHGARQLRAGAGRGREELQLASPPLPPGEGRGEGTPERPILSRLAFRLVPKCG